jgi:hypothetical protein
MKFASEYLAPRAFRLFVFTVSLLSITANSWSQTGTQQWSAITSGYAVSEGGGVSLSSAVGQTAVGSSSTGNLVLRHGFLNYGVLEGASPGMSLVVVNTSDSGEGSLRAAILEANGSSGTVEITFNIPGEGVRTITLLTPLPAISRPVKINGFTQPGSTANTQDAGLPTNAVILVELNGQTSGGIGLQLQGGSSTVRGLAVNRFATGIHITEQGNNVIEGNAIGSDPSGVSALPNSRGILIATANNRVGGSLPASRNVISGNQATGITIQGLDATSNQVLGNYIGTTASGTAELANGAGVWLEAGGNVVGGPDITSRNVILGGSNSAIYLNAGFPGGNTIQHNYIATDAAGTTGLGAGGVRVYTGGNQIRNNVISGSGGVLLQEEPATGNIITGNLVGLAASGDAVLGNNGGGVSLLRAPGNQIGGTTLEDRNVIATTNHGVFLTTANNNIVQGNYIGTNAEGTVMMPPGGSSGSGVWINGNGNLIGGTVPGARNVISGSHTGVLITGGAHENVVQGNYIGTSADGMVAIPNSNQGVHIVTPQGSQTTRNNLIGGIGEGAGNLISGNNLRGLWIFGAEDITVQGNTIGISADGVTPLPNLSHGVEVSAGHNNMIGGTSPGAGNRIAYNGLGQQQMTANGVYVWSGTGNAILGNEIYANRRLAIDLAGGAENSFGVTANDPDDSDTGANNLQNYPDLLSAVTAGTSVHIAGSLESVANGTFRIEFFSAPEPDPSGHGGGRHFLGAQEVQTGEDHNASFDVILDGVVEPGHVITATATDAANNTSEFAASVRAEVVTSTPDDELPIAFELLRTFPNPFASTTNITFHLPEPGKVDLRIYDPLGRLVAILAEDHRGQGAHTIRWDAGGMATGIYFLRLRMGEYHAERRLAVVR